VRQSPTYYTRASFAVVGPLVYASGQMRNWLNLAFFITFVTSCAPAEPATIVVAGSDFGPEEGKPVKVSVVDVGAKKVIVQSIPTTVAAGKINVSVQVAPDVTYRVDVFIDDDGDGHCQWANNVAGFDHAYAVDVAPIAEGKTFTANLMLANNDSRGCLSYGSASLHFQATQLNSGMSAPFTAALIRLDGPIVLGKRVGVEVNGTIDYTFAGAIFPGKQYRVDFYIDKDGLQGCSSADLAYREAPKFSVSGQPQDGLSDTTLELMVDGATANLVPDACSTFQ